MTSLVKEIFTECDTEPTPTTQHTPEKCKASTQTEDSNIYPKRIVSLKAHMAALKSFLKDEIDDLKNQIESDNTGIDEFELFFSLREQI